MGFNNIKLWYNCYWAEIDNKGIRRHFSSLLVVGNIEILDEEKIPFINML